MLDLLASALLLLSTTSVTTPTEATVDDIRAHRVVVVLDEQHAYVYDRSDHLIGRWPVSTGGSGHRTPTGNYTVTTRTRVGTARGDGRVHMDWFTRFHGGIGFHGIPWRDDRSQRFSTPLGRRAVSHGCVRMADRHARRLYLELPDDAHIHVVYRLGDKNVDKTTARRSDAASEMRQITQRPSPLR